MNNNDTILKYLSGLLDEKGKSDFEKRLVSDTELKAEFERISEQLNNLKFTPVVDEDYFANLEQRVRESSSHRSKSHLHGFSLAFGTLFSILIIFAVVNFFIGKSGSNVNSDKFSSQIVVDSDELADNYTISDLENLGITADDYFSAGFSEISQNDLITYFNETDLDDISEYLFSDIANSESFSEMINEIKNIKY